MKKMTYNAVIFCEGAFQTTNGKTAHGLVRFSRRYNIVCVIDSGLIGRDAGEVLDGKNRNIPVVASVEEAHVLARARGGALTHFVVGIAPDGGRMEPRIRNAVLDAIKSGLNVESGLHDFLSEDPEVVRLASTHNVEICDVRKPPDRTKLHFFTGDIAEVSAFRIALLGTDSAVGKRTTAWVLVEGFEAAGLKAEMIGTGQTAWLQGARYGIVLDSLVNDFIAGELENAVVGAWRDQKPDVIVIEGQGSLLNPAYPGGMEILAATRPDAIVLQHAPARREYDGFPGCRMHPLREQIEALEAVSAAPVSAVVLNHEGLSEDAIPLVCDTIESAFGIPCVDILVDGPDKLINTLRDFMKSRPSRSEQK